MTVPDLMQCTQISRLQELKRELRHFVNFSAYTSNLTPRDFHLFCSLKKHLDGKRFSGDAEVEHEVQTRLMEQTTAALE
jgi:hypothetical protein